MSPVTDSIRDASKPMPDNLVKGQNAQDVAAYVAQAILSEASLSFLGLGVTEPLQDINAPIVAQFTDSQAYAKYKLDLKQVDSLLTGAGYAKGSDGMYAKGGQPLTFAVRTTAGNKRRETTQQILQDELKTAGIGMTVDNIKAGDLFGTALPAGDFQSAIYAQNLTTLQASTCTLFCSKNAKPIGTSATFDPSRSMVTMCSGSPVQPSFAHRLS